MRPTFIVMAISLISLGMKSLQADTAAEIYQRRVIPLLQSNQGSSCSECHLQGIQLTDLLSSDPKETFASLRSRGWIDLDQPSESKLLQFISKSPDQSTELMDRVRASELEAIGAWIRAAAQDPESLNAPLPELKDLHLDETMIRHARKDRILQRFVDIVWSQLERCANCHSPDRNAKQVAKHGEQMSWIVPKSPADTLRLLEERKLINLDDPLASPLKTKALGQNDHGGGVKFPVDGQTDREWGKFLSDYVAIKRNSYQTSADLPLYESIRTFRTGLHLKIKDLPKLSAGQYAVVLVDRLASNGTVTAEAVAMGEGRIAMDGSSWSTTLILLEPPHLRQTEKSIDWSSLLPDGKYQLRWIPNADSTLSIEQILSMRSSMRTEIHSLWPPGHSAAKQISFGDFILLDSAN